MKRLRIYLDTSIISFLYADDAPEFKKITKDFFNNYLKPKTYDAFISEIVLKEIEGNTEKILKDRMLAIVREYELPSLPLTPESAHLAELYLQECILPRRKLDDARHVAIAACNQMDILLSWNFRHLANVPKQRAVKVINEREGFIYPLIMSSPLEAINEEDKED